MRKAGRSFSLLIPVITFMALMVCLNGCESQEKAKEEKLKATIRRVIVEAWNEGNIDALDELYAADFIRHRPPFPDIEGLDAHKKRVKVVRSAYPDHKTIIHDIIVDGETVALWYTWRGTHTGQGMSIPPTGKQVSVAGCDVYKIVDGKVVEEWDNEGFLSLFQQLGYEIVPPITESTFARVTVTQMKPEKVAEAVKIYGESVVPDAKLQKGFRGIYLLSNFKTGKGYSIAMWDSEEDAIANEQSGYYKAQVDKFKDLLTAKPVREGYKITVQE